jgi:UDP-N-acetylmuramate dehydrogenase
MAPEVTMPLQRDVPLRHLNTFGLDSTARFFARIDNMGTLHAALAAADHGALDLIVIGGGSNILLPPYIDGCVLQIAFKGIAFDDADGGSVHVTAAAGESWHGLVRACLGRGLWGIENLALIPGSVGAAPMQNIGAYGVELRQCVASVAAVCRRTGAERTFTADACQFGYRDSVFKRALRDRYLITSVTLRLNRVGAAVTSYPDVARELARMAAPPTAANVAEAVIRVRRRKLPSVRRLGNAGSFFKNPVITRAHYDVLRERLPGLGGFEDQHGIKVPAAHLIDATGWKGRRRGGAMVWPRQPLVLVNAGGATAADVLGLAAEIEACVRERFGVELEREVQVIGS